MFVSRTSVQMFTINRVDVLSVLQLINMVVWIVDVHVSTRTFSYTEGGRDK